MMFPGKTSSLMSSQIIHSANPILQTRFKHCDYTAWTDAKSAFMELESKSVNHSVMSNHSDSKGPACNAGNLGLIPGFGRFPGERNDNPLQYSCLENPHWQRSLADYSPWGHKKSDTTEWLSTEHITLMLFDRCKTAVFLKLSFLSERKYNPKAKKIN